MKSSYVGRVERDDKPGARSQLNLQVGNKSLGASTLCYMADEPHSPENYSVRETVLTDVQGKLPIRHKGPKSVSRASAEEEEEITERAAEHDTDNARAVNAPLSIDLLFPPS